MSDLSTVASLLKDTNKKLDKLHSDNEQNDTPADIIKGAIPEILADTLNTQRNIDSINDRQEDENKNDDKQMKADQVASDKQLKILGEIKNPMVDLGEIKKPMVDLGLAIPKSGFNAFSKKANDISAEKALPSDFKLMLQALTPKALTEGFKIGLGDMFKELGGGIKNIGRGMKSLATKGLTAAQKKSEEKEKESKDKKKDSFLKKTFGGVLNLLGNIWKTAKLAGKAGFLALLGAGALYALAKLIESPRWNEIAGVMEYGLGKVIDLFEYMDEQFGVGGVIATALALWYGTTGIFTLAGMAVKALGKKLFLKGATDTLAGAAGGATTALGSKANKLSLLGRLGLLGIGLGAAALAMYGLSVAIDWFHDRAAKAETKTLNTLTKDVDKQTPLELQRRKKVADDITSRRNRQRTDDPLVKEQLRKANAAQKIIADAAKKKLDQKPPVDAAVYGGSPKEIRAIIAKSFKEAIAATHFEGNAKNRLGQLKELFGGVSSKLLGKEFQALDAKKKSAFLKLLKSEEQSAFTSIRKGGKSNLSGQAGSTAFRGGMDKKDAKELMLGYQAARKSLFNLRKSQIKDPNIIGLNSQKDSAVLEANRALEAAKKKKEEAAAPANSPISVITGGNSSSSTSLSIPPQSALTGPMSGAGQVGIYGHGLGY